MKEILATALAISTETFSNEMLHFDFKYPQLSLQHFSTCSV